MYELFVIDGGLFFDCGGCGLCRVVLCFDNERFDVLVVLGDCFLK